MRYANIMYNDIVNTNGISLTFFCQGCPHHCEGCFQPQTWDFKGGMFLSDDKIKEMEYCLKNYKYDYLCLLGGEPLANLETSEFIISLCKKHQPNIKVWCYTGYLFNNVSCLNIMKSIDVLVDGRFVKELYDPTLKFKGSSNQRIIDVKATFEKGEIVLTF